MMSETQAVKILVRLPADVSSSLISTGTRCSCNLSAASTRERTAARNHKSKP
jgi:hypothetical protein